MAHPDEPRIIIDESNKPPGRDALAATGGLRLQDQATSGSEKPGNAADEEDARPAADNEVIGSRKQVSSWAVR